MAEKDIADVIRGRRREGRLVLDKYALSIKMGVWC